LIPKGTTNSENRFCSVMAGDVRFVVPDRTVRATKSICVVSRARMTN
jgi:hypothetical protein